MSIISVVKPAAPVAGKPENDADHWIVSLRDSQLAVIAKERDGGKLPSKYTELGQEMLAVYFAFSTLSPEVQRKALASIDLAKIPKNGSKK